LAASALLVHGSDNMSTGGRTVIDGKPYDTQTNLALQAMGLSHETATWIELTFGVGGPMAAAGAKIASNASKLPPLTGGQWVDEVAKGGVGLGNQNPLYKAAVQQFKSTDLSNAGRALTKHPELVGKTKDTLRQALPTDGAINDAAHSVLRDIMRNGVTTNPTLGRYGTVTQIQVPGGFGARWASDGSFIGFINP
jgi:hypothetical protein